MIKWYKSLYVVLAVCMTCILCGCKISMLSDVKTTSINGVTVQHSINFDNVYDIDDGDITGFKFNSLNNLVGEPHYDYGWALLINTEITDINALQEKLRTYTCANMTNKWFETRNTKVDGTTTMQGYYENVAPGVNGFADQDVISDKYKVDVYSVAKDGYTIVCILAINQSSTQLVRDETSLMQGTLSMSENFVDAIGK